MAEELGVSRGAVREALQRLAQAGLVDIQHGGGTTVTHFRHRAGLDLLVHVLADADGEIDPAVAYGVLEMRAALAPDVARLCALRATPSVDRALGDALVQLRADDDLAARLRASGTFWQVVVDGSGNLAYQLAFNSLRDAQAGIDTLVAEALASEWSDLDGFQTIADAIARRDPEGAAHAARKHVRATPKGEDP